ncbi:MAG: amidohydrolase family protein [Gammaproteobacteria bacterium]|nr:amidohydrolase family protein [Gammaproteobacteria bacterium]
MPSLNPIALSLSLTLALGFAVPGQAADLVIDQVTVLSPERPAETGRQVWIRDGRIAKVAATPEAVPAGTPRLDGRGRFLTPGLMDSHVHLAAAPGLLPTAAPELHAAFARQQPRSYLYHGVTQVVDLAADAQGTAAFEAQAQHPAVFRCGPLAVWGGYPLALMPPEMAERWRDNVVVEASAGTEDKAHTPEAIVARIAESGARCVKVFVEDGFGDAHHWPIPSKDTLRRVRDAAHARGLLVVAHANASDMLAKALDGGVDVIAHGDWNWTPAERSWAAEHGQGVPASVAALMARVHEQGLGYQPTLRVLPGLAALFQAETLADPAYAKVVPPALLAWYGHPEARWFAEALSADTGGEPIVLPADHASTGTAQRALRHLHGLGHPLLLGSDTPSAPTYGNQPGYNSYQELRAMAEAGIPLDAVFRAATLNNARQFGLEAEYGTVSAGKRANLLLLSANPLEDVTAWNRIATVILDGEALDRESLAAR